MHRPKEGFVTNTKGIANEALPFFLFFLVFALIAAVLIQSNNVGLVARGSISTTPIVTNATTTISLPATAKDTAQVLRFHANLPDYEHPQNQAVSDVLPAEVPLMLLISGVSGVDYPTSASVSMDDSLVSSNYTWDATKKIITFPDVLASDESLPEGKRKYSFNVHMSNGLTFNFSQFVQLDRTAPQITSMTLSSNRRMLTFTVRDPSANNEAGAGLSLWNSGDVADMLNVALIRTHASGANPYELETGLPAQLVCVPTQTNSDAEISCTYPFAAALPTDKMPVVFVSDDAGNRTARALVGNYSDYEESILTRMFDPKTLKLEGEEIPSEVVASLQSATPIVLDIYVFHAATSAPTAQEITSQWTVGQKVQNAVSKAMAAGNYWKAYINQMYPGKGPTFQIGEVVAFVGNTSLLSTADTALLTQPPVLIPSSAYPGFFSSSSCDIVAGSSVLHDFCIDEIEPCSFLGCSSTTDSWIVRHKLNLSPNRLVDNKIYNHLPVIFVDRLANHARGDVLGGQMDAVHGALYVSYTSHITPPSYHLSSAQLQTTLTHEIGHALGLGHTDRSNNIMTAAAHSTGTNLSETQGARVQAGLARGEFRPPAIGVWWSKPPAASDIEFAQCGPIPTTQVSANARLPRLLDTFSNDNEETEAPYSGVPQGSNDVLSQSLKQKYCPLVYDGARKVIQPAPEAVDEGNLQFMLQQYPGAAIKFAVPNSCTCQVDPQFGSGPSGPGTGTRRTDTVPTGGGGGAGGDAKTKEHSSPKTNCGKEVPGYSLPQSSGGTFVVYCPKEACPSLPATSPGGAETPQSCQAKEGAADCGERAFVEIGSQHFCCMCQPTSPPGDPVTEDDVVSPPPVEVGGK